MRQHVVVRGMGLSCALGEGVDTCLARLQQRAVTPQILELDGFEERITMPFYAIPGAADLFDPTRATTLLPRIAREAIASAGLSTADVERMPIYIGASAFSMRRSAIKPLIPNEARDVALALPLIGYEQIAGTLHRALGSRGEIYGFNTACTSAANAVMSASRMIRLGWHDHALVIGLELASLPALAGFSGLQLLADEVKPFDVHRRGIVLGEAIGAVVLSASGGNAGGIRITDGASNIDSYRVTAAHPDGRTIAALQETLLSRAGVDRAEIRGIKSHGTASPMNDTSEAAGINRVFSTVPPLCALKPYIGHTLGACGVTELVLMGSALSAGFFPATTGFDSADPALKISPRVEASAAPDGFYLLNYFGFGGHNTALLVEKRS